MTEAILWIAESEDQDFRDEQWADSTLFTGSKSEITFEVKHPGSGFKAFYVDLKYKAPLGDEYTQSTRMFVADSIKLLLRSN